MEKVKLNFPGVSRTNVCLLLSLVSIPVEHLEQTAGSALLLYKRFFFPLVYAGSKAAPTQPRAAFLLATTSFVTSPSQP